MTIMNISIWVMSWEGFSMIYSNEINVLKIEICKNIFEE
jgi:hypothetical protein